MDATSHRRTGRRDCADSRHSGAHDERNADDQHAGQRDVRVGVCNTCEDSVVLEQPLEASQVHAARRASGAMRRSAIDNPRQSRVCPAATRRSAQDTRAAGDNDKQGGDHAGDHGQRQQPAGDELPGRQRKQVKAQGPPENRVERCRVTRRVPPERQCRPASHHAGADRGGDGKGQAERDQIERRIQPAVSPVGG